jgi:hypothetical protein
MMDVLYTTSCPIHHIVAQTKTAEQHEQVLVLVCGRHQRQCVVRLVCLNCSRLLFCVEGDVTCDSSCMPEALGLVRCLDSACQPGGR